MEKQKNFTVGGMVIILAAVAILLFLVFYLAEPKEILAKTRDTQRLTSIKSLGMAIDLYLADGGDFSKLENGKIYQSNTGTNLADGTGWLPLNFGQISSGRPIDVLPRDPAGDAGKYVFIFTANKINKTYELNCRLEDKSSKEKARSDQGSDDSVFEIGTDLGLIK